MGAWAADIEADGDLDIVLGTKDGRGGLRNNGDDTFLDTRPFEGFPGYKDLPGPIWTRMVIDAAQIMVRPLHALAMKTGTISGTPARLNFAPVRTINVEDANNDGVLDLLVTG